jgi:predicted acetyltransferase
MSPPPPRKTCAPTGLRLRPLRPDDETAFRAGHQMMAGDDFTFGLGLRPGLPWAAYLAALEDHRLGRNLPDELVPATFLAAEAAGQLVGRTSIRHELNAELKHQGGHIGYGVLPEHRRRGYATEILRQSLIIARSVGVGPALLICSESNAGSRTAIERCGGQLDSVGTDNEGTLIRRYWID